MRIRDIMGVRRIAVFIACLIFSPEPLLAKPIDFTRVKSAIVYKFPQFCDWKTPQGTTAKTLTIGIVGKAGVLTYLLPHENKLIKGTEKILRLQSFPRHQKGFDFSGCDVLFISKSEIQHYKNILKLIEKKDILTIGEGEGFVEVGGMISLHIRGHRIAWEINHQAISQTNMRLGSQIYRLAFKVVK